MQVTRTLTMLAPAASGYPTYSVRPSGGSWSNPTNSGVTRHGSTANYSVDLDLAPGPYSVEWAPSADPLDATVDDFAVGPPQTGDAFARLGPPAGSSIAADIATRSTYAGGAVASVTGNVGGNVVGSVASVVNLTPLLLPSGTVAASPAPTTTGFTAAGTLNATAGAYAPTAKRTRFVYWATGANAGETSAIATYPGSGAFTLDAAPTGTIHDGDTFIVL